MTTLYSTPRVSTRSSARMFRDAASSEWVKLRTIRSSAWTLITVIVVFVGLAAAVASAAAETAAQSSVKDQASLIAAASTGGVFIGQLLIAILGVLVISGEYSTGMIRSTLVATPHRLIALFAKTLVTALAAFLTGLLGGLGALAVSLPIFGNHGVTAPFLSPAILLPLLWESLYLAAVAVFAIGLGTVLRSAAGGISTTIGVMLLLPIVFNSIPAAWAQHVGPYLMMNAGLSAVGVSLFGGPSPLNTGEQLLVVAAWAGLVYAAGCILLVRRDA